MNSVRVNTIDGNHEEHWQCCKDVGFTAYQDEAMLKITIPESDLTVFYPLKNVKSIYVWEGR